MSKLKLKWQRFLSFEGMSLQYCDQVEPELYAVVPQGEECGDSPHATLYTNLEEAMSVFKTSADEIITAFFAEDGEVVVVESGRDCDGVDYWGKKYRIKANYNAFCDLRNEISEWADGPFRLELCRPSEADQVKYESVDRVMEAFEDGHRHVIYSSFPG